MTELSDDQIDAYVQQIVTAARNAKSADDAIDAVNALIGEFQEKCYLAGRHALIDRLRRELDGADNRP